MKNLRSVWLLLAAGLLLVQCTSSGRGQPAKVRPAVAAGSFYPADPKELEAMVDGFLAKAAPPPEGRLVALVAPHAGYVYSGAVAAQAYACLKGKQYDRVVVVAPSHYEAFGFSSVYDGAAYTTPLGQVPVDRAFASKLAELSPSIKLSSSGHVPSPERLEHALEVQLPFLQRALGRFQLVPIVMGEQSYDNARALGAALAKAAADSSTLIVASSDLSHYHPYAEAVNLDRKTLNAVAEYDYLNLSRNLEFQVWEACGGGPIIAAMIAAERLGATNAKVLRYANSGDATGDRSRVVGYGAVALVQAPGGRGGAAAFSLTGAEKNKLLEIARKSVEMAVQQHKFYEASAAGLDALQVERGAFVTLTENGQLRGCIGYISPLKPLYLTVRDVARMAALEDSRFRPVTAAELGSLEYEISVLSPLHHVRDVNEIRVGEHGLLIYAKGREGLLLPQVPTEQGWDRATFLEQVCLKAGLAPRTWADPGADLFRFTALVFGGQKPSSVRLFGPPATWPTSPGPSSPWM